MKTYWPTLDLHDDPVRIAEYKRYHRQENIWPEVVEHLKGHGILSEEIYLLGTRLVMVLQTTNDFSIEEKFPADQSDPKMQE